jgi:hypothetical protein
LEKKKRRLIESGDVMEPLHKDFLLSGRRLVAYSKKPNCDRYYQPNQTQADQSTPYQRINLFYLIAEGIGSSSSSTANSN